MNLSKVSWISSRNVAKLKQIGICTTGDLLRAGNDSRCRARLAKRVGVTRRKVLGWVRSADLSRVNGVGDDYVIILTRTKVYTPQQLAQQEPDYLLTQIAMTNATHRLVKRMPASTSISQWITNAQMLPMVVSYEQ